MCRSETLPPARPYATWVLGGLLLGVVGVSAAALAARTVASLARAGIAREPLGTGVPSGASSSVGASMPAAAEPTASLPLAPPSPPAGPVVPLDAAAELPEAPPPALPSLSPSAASSSPALPNHPGPTAAEIRAAFSATPIVIYSASWCGVCRKAKAFLQQNGLRYREIDADDTAGAWEQIERLTGRRAVPLIIVDGEQTPGGLNPTNVMRAVTRSMERRLGVAGIRLESN